jgi:hypothetical protein
MERVREGRVGSGEPQGQAAGRGGTFGPAVLAGFLLLLGAACTSSQTADPAETGAYPLGQVVKPAVTTPADSYMTAGGLFGPAWGSQPPEQVLASSVTIARLATSAPAEAELLPEPGNVWPGPLPPRTTLANPDAAMRGIPEYRGPDSSTFAPESSRPVAPGPGARGLPGQLRGSSTPSSLLNTPPPSYPSPSAAPPPLPPAATLPDTMPPRADGNVVQTPNGPVVTTGGTSRTQTYIGPGGETGTVTRDGPFTTVNPIGQAPRPGVPVR